MAVPLGACGSAEAPSPTPESPAAPSVVVTAARWEEPQRVADAGERPFARCSPFTTRLCRLFHPRTAPAVAVNAPGHTVALWQRYEGDGFRLVGARVTAGGAWSEAERITPDAEVSSQQVVIDPRGNAFARWIGSGGTETSYGPAGGAWGPPQAAEASEQLVMDDGGAAHTLFTRWREGLFWSRRAPGASWSEPVMLQGQGPEPHPSIRDPRLAVTRDGAVHAVWIRQFQSSAREEEWEEVWSSRMRPGGGWSAPALVARLPRAHALSLTMAASDSAALASYMLWDGRDSRRIMEQHQAVGGPAWTAPTAVSEPAPPPPMVRNPDLPVAASAPGGALTLAWKEVTYGPSAPPRFEIRARRFSAAGGAWEHAQLIQSREGFLHDLFDLHVAASAAGDAVVLWVEQDAFDFGHRLWASVFVPGVGWSAPHALRDAELMSEPALAMDGSGHAIVMWSEPEGDRTTIWSARLAAVTTGP
jgi:hypothetical protein